MTPEQVRQFNAELAANRAAGRKEERAIAGIIRETG